MHCIHTTYRRVLELINFISLNPRLLLASVFAILGIAAEIEQPGFFPRLKELGIALVAIVCGSSVVINALALERLSEGAQFGIDEVWSVMWRWICDVISDEERIVGEDENRQAEEVTMMFSKGGTSVFLLDTPNRHRAGTTIQTPLAAIIPQQLSGSDIPRETLNQSRSPFFPLPSVAFPQSCNSPPSLHRQEHETIPIPSTQKPLHHFITLREAGIDVSGLLVEEETHASGLLGQSPMPSHSTVPNQWKNFSGKGFYKYYQKLEAVSKWQNPGSSRSFEDVPKNIESMDGRNQEREDGSTVGIEAKAEQKKRGDNNLI